MSNILCFSNHWQYVFIWLYYNSVREAEEVYCDLQSYSSYFTDGKTEEGYILLSTGNTSSNIPLPNKSRDLMIHPQIALKHSHVFEPYGSEFHRYPQPWIVLTLMFMNWHSKQIVLSTFWKRLNRNGRQDHHHERKHIDFWVPNTPCLQISLN